MALGAEPYRHPWLALVRPEGFLGAEVKSASDWLTSFNDGADLNNEPRIEEEINRPGSAGNAPKRIL